MQLDIAYFNKDWKQAIAEFRNHSHSQTGQTFKEFGRIIKCEAEFHLKKYDLALLTAGKMISPDQDYRIFMFYRPFGYYWQGRIYEEQGKTADAINSYEKLMELWKDGDERIPERKDTVQRLKNLRKTI
jgi:tetratricopeptide (TPR) repeat protein